MVYKRWRDFYACYCISQLNPLNSFISDDRQEQQNDSAPELSGANRAAGLAYLHRYLQSLRQTHELDPRRLRGVPEDSLEEFQGARARGEARAGLCIAARREHSFTDGGGTTAARGGPAPSSHSGSSSWSGNRSRGRTRNAYQLVRRASGSPGSRERCGRTRPTAHGSDGTRSATSTDDGCPATGHDSRRHALDARKHGTRCSATDARTAAQHDPWSTTTGQGWLLSIKYNLIKTHLENTT